MASEQGFHVMDSGVNVQGTYDTGTGSADFVALGNGLRRPPSAGERPQGHADPRYVSDGSIISPSGGISYDRLQPYILPIIGGLAIGYLLMGRK